MNSNAYFEGLYSVHQDSAIQKQRFDAGKKTWVKDRRAKAGGYWRKNKGPILGAAAGVGLLGSIGALEYARRKLKNKRNEEKARPRTSDGLKIKFKYREIPGDKDAKPGLSMDELMKKYPAEKLKDEKEFGNFVRDLGPL